MTGGPESGGGVAFGNIKDDGAVGLDRDGGFGVAERKLGGVVFFRQVREPNRVRTVLERVFAQKTHSGFVGQVALVAQNAGFQVAGIFPAG